MRKQRSRKCKRPNALKHGVYAQVPFIPGEDPSEFDKLYAELIHEWEPSGPTPRFALSGLADLMWRMRRLKKFGQTQLRLTTFDPHSPSFDEAWGLIMFTSCLSSEPETCFEQSASSYLLPDTINHLKQNFRRSDYQSISQWATAITVEIIIVLHTRVTEGKIAGTFEMDEDSMEEAREWKTDQQVAGTMVYAREILEYDFKETERLEARIAKQTRYCAELKAMEEIRSRT